MGRAQPERNVEREKPGRAGPEEAFTIERSLPHGHVEAVLAMTRRLVDLRLRERPNPAPMSKWCWP